jgi:isocitrate/isopropylmalate dehydrogenase
MTGRTIVMLEAIHDGVATSDLGGSASTSDFTDEVINRAARKLEVWGTPG